MTWLHRLESLLSWLFAYPLLPLLIVFFYMIGLARLGYGLGADDLFWSEQTWEQFLNGLACGFLFGEIFLVRYLLDPKRSDLGFRVSLFAVENPVIKKLGQYLLLFWIPSLLVFGLKLFSRDVRERNVSAWPLLVGLAMSVGVVFLLVQYLTQWSYTIMAIEKLFPNRPTEQVPAPKKTFATHSSPPLTADPALHSAALVTFLIAFTGLLGILLPFWWGYTVPPFVVLCVLLGLIVASYGFLAFRFPGSQYVVFLILVGIGIWANSDQEQDYKLTFPNLETFYTKDSRVNLEEEEYYKRLVASQNPDFQPAPNLINSDTPLDEMKKRWQEKHPGQKPKLILISTSGGGIRAAVWTGVVYEGLELAFKDTPFLEHIRLIAGASGGMVGMGLIVPGAGDDFEPISSDDQQLGLGKYSSRLAKDSLRRPVQTMLLRDLPTLFRSGSVSWDRGREIEKVWKQNTETKGKSSEDKGKSPYSKKFSDLRDQEEKGLIPSLIFSPMMVEDVRRLLISNLDLNDLTSNSGAVLDRENFPKESGLQGFPPKSLSAVEFFRLFPGAKDKFEIGTAARMNASFPLVSPGVSLPTVPPRRIVDAGYFDNYGIDLLANWLLKHEQAIRDNTSGVLLLEIRAYRSSYGRSHFQDRAREKIKPEGENAAKSVQRARRDNDGLVASLEWLSTPIEAVLNTRERAPIFRNDEMLDLVDRTLNGNVQGTSPDRFFATISFECDVDAALSWTLPRGEAKAIARAFKDENGETQPVIQKKIDALKTWFGTGGR